MRRTLFVLALLLIHVCHGLVRNAAFSKSYTVSEPGAVAIRYASRGEGDYQHEHIYSTDASQALTCVLSEPLTSLPRGLIWHHANNDFNVTIVVDMETPISPALWRISGSCCNLGIFTPIAAYVQGSVSLSDGPWTFLGAKWALTSGDEIDTPAETYQLDIDTSASSSDAFRFYQITVTGAMNRFMSIFAVQMLVED